MLDTQCLPLAHFSPDSGLFFHIWTVGKQRLEEGRGLQSWTDSNTQVLYP